MAGEWRESTVGEIAAPVRNALVGGPFGSNLVSRDYVGAGVPVVRGQNMGSRWVAGEFAYVSSAKAASLEANLARPGDIVFTQRGTLGQVSIVPSGRFDRYVVSQSQMKLTVNRELADPLFIYYVFSSAEQQDYILQNAIQTGVPHTNLGILRGTPVPLPPLPEQRAIAHILGTLDDKIELNRRMNEALEAIARALFKSWFVDFDPVRARAEGRDPYFTSEIWNHFPSSFDNDGRPVGWRLSIIGNEVKTVGGGTPSTKELRYWRDGIHHWATPKDLSKLAFPVLLSTERKITDAGLKKISSGLLPTGTVLLSSRAPIGYLAIAEMPTAVNQGFIAMVCNQNLPNLFVLFWCHENLEYIKAIAGGSTFAEISKKAFRSVPVVIPPEYIIRAFYGFVRPLFGRLVINARENETLAQMRDALLPKLISGELRVKDAEKFIALAM